MIMWKKLHSICIEGKCKFPMKIISIATCYIIPFILGAMLLYAHITTGDMYFLSKEYGKQALNILLIILFLKPISQIFFRVKILSRFLIFRKHLGIIMFWLFLGHSIGTTFATGLEYVISSITSQGLKSYYLWGLLGGIIIFFMGMTSNMKAMKILKKYWKFLHSFVYFAFFFTVLHVYFITGEIRYIVVFIIYVILKILASRGFKV